MAKDIYKKKFRTEVLGQVLNEVKIPPYFSRDRIEEILLEGFTINSEFDYIIRVERTIKFLRSVLGRDPGYEITADERQELSRPLYEYLAHLTSERSDSKHAAEEKEPGQLFDISEKRKK